MAKQKVPIAVTFSDLHLEKYQRFNEGNRRLNNAIDVLRRIALKSKKLKVPTIFGGDLFHKEEILTNEILYHTLPAIDKYWAKHTEKIYAISGNHDQCQQSLINKESISYIGTVSKLYSNVINMDFHKEELTKGIDLYGIPYITLDIGFKDYIENLKIDKKKKNILLIHTTMPNAKDTNGMEIDSHLDAEFYEVCSKFDLVLCGHIHKPMSFKKGKTTYIQIGAPQQQRLTDKDCDMGYWVLYNDMTADFIPLDNYPKFVIVNNINDKLTDGNFYIVEPPKKVKLDIEETKRDFSNRGNYRKLASNYCKEKKIKDKVKKDALYKSLKNSGYDKI